MSSQRQVRPTTGTGMIGRRRFLRAAGALPVAAIGSPWIARHGLASSGEVNVYAWGDYVQTFNEGGLANAFEDATGIKINLSTYASNEELQTKLAAAGAKGFDVVFPSVDTGPNYYRNDLLQPIDERKVKLEQVIPAIWRQSLKLGAANRGKRFLVPFDWGTEAMTWDSARHPDLRYGTISYGDLFKGDVKAAMRQKSVFTGIALHLDATGDLKSDRAMDFYKSEEECRRVFDGCLKFAAAHKKNIGAFWNNATEATAAFTDAGCTIGQTWDTTGILLHRNQGPSWHYTMPEEGGLGWLDTMAIPVGAANLEQAYAFINFMLTPKAGGTFSNKTGYNSAAVGADQHLSEEGKAAFAMAYPDQAAIESLWWWPAQTAFYEKLRGEYVEKLTNA